MLFDKNDGADVVSFVSANYGSNTGNSLQLAYSIDQGGSWTSIGEVVSPGSELELFEIEVGVSDLFVSGGYNQVTDALIWMM